jgi:hypothetical protein
MGNRAAGRTIWNALDLSAHEDSAAGGMRPSSLLESDISNTLSKKTKQKI